MLLMLMFLWFVTLCVAVFYYFKFEWADEEVMELKEEIEECRQAFREIEEDIIKKSQLNSAKNIQNKLKTILENTTLSNIV